MATKKCVILTKSPTLGSMLQGYGYETIVLSDSSTFVPILTNIVADLVVIDDVATWRSLLPAILALPQPPTRITIRDDIEDPAMDQKNIIHVKTQTTDSVWWEIIEQNNKIEEQSSEEITPKKDKILVVDDVVELADMYKIMFELKGYEVETASDGLEWITKAVAFQPKYILLDIMMPHMDGFSLMKTFRENTSLDSVIIVNSNIEGPDMSNKIYSAWADYYIRKSDYSPTQIVYMIEQGMFAKKRSATNTNPAQ